MFSFIEDLGAAVDCLDVSADHPAVGIRRAAVDDYHIAVAQLFKHDAAHVVHKCLKGCRIDRGENLNQRPERRHSAEQGLTDCLTSVVFNEDLGRVVDRIEFLHAFRCQIRHIFEVFHEGIVRLAPCLVILGFSFFKTEDQCPVDTFHEVCVIERILDQRGLSAVQKAGEQIYRTWHQ